MRKHHLIVLLILSLGTIASENLFRTYNKHENDFNSFNTSRVSESSNDESTTLTDVTNEEGNTTEVPRPKPAAATNMPELEVANPAEEVTIIAPPAANNMGSATLEYPIKLPPGRQGMEPQLAIQYNSESGNGWLGLDWSLTTPAITIDTRWGVPRYNATDETETYSMNGEQLSPVAHRSAPLPRGNDSIFHQRVEKDFNKIVRHGNHPNSYWWEVTEKNGTRHFFGGKPGIGVISDAVLTDANNNIGYWGLVETKDANNNFIRYNYHKEPHPGFAGGNPGIDIYLSFITYTGHGTTEGKYRIDFLRDRTLGENPRQDISISGRLGFKQVTADLLSKVTVKYNDQPIRTYDLEYDTGAFFKTLLKSISEYDAVGTLFTTHSFEYYNDVQKANGVYEPLDTAQAWIPRSDDIKGTFINPIEHFNDKASMLGGTKSLGGGFGIAVTLGPYDGNLSQKSNTAGVAFGFNYTKNEGMLALVDINGDGLPDKVYKKGTQLFFRKNLSGPSGPPVFDTEQKNIYQINDFGKGETFTVDIGLESHFVVFAGFEYAHTEDLTSIYFTDANGDMLMDIVKDGQVYFNHLDNDGNPTFTASSDDTPSPINSASSIDQNLVENDPQALEQAIDENPLNDIVKIWKAPFNGTVSISQGVQLLQNTNPDAQIANNDGVRVAIQHNGAELWSTLIEANDFLIKTPSGVNSINVQKGDHIYFRVQSRENGENDFVKWAPQVTYSNHTNGLNDADNLPIYQFKADDDFLLSDSLETGVAFSGQLQITGTFVKPVTTDNVTVKIIKKSGGVLSTLFQQSFAWNQVANLPISFAHNVLKNDALFFSVSSNSNIDWASLKWIPYVYFTSSADPAIPQVIGNNGNPLFYFYPTVDFQSYNRTLAPSNPWQVPSNGSYSIQANPSFVPLTGTGDLVFSIKKANQLIAQQVIPVTLGVMGAHPVINLSLTNGEKLFFEYHTREQSLADVIVDAKTTVGPSQVESGLHTYDTSFIFGPLYRHWGQFAYNGNRTRANQPIIETDLHLDESLTDQTPPTIDLSGANTIDGMQNIYENGGGNNPKDDKFFYLVPNNEKRQWLGYDNLTYVMKDTLSSSRLGKDNLLPPNPITNPSAQSASGASAITKVSTTDNFSLGVGIGPAGLGVSFGFTNSLYDYTDINGDKYPDILSKNKIQFTHPYGGLESSAKNYSFDQEQVINSEHFSVGFTLGGSYVRSNSPNNKATSKGSKAAGAASQASASAGISLNFNYNRDSVAYSWMDINGDDLADRVYRNGEVQLNIGYTFLKKEQWGYRGISEGESFSYGGGVSINIGSYSIAAGIGLMRSENETLKSLQDMNGDGLLDYISSVSPLRVGINKGNGFAAPIIWEGASAIHKATSTGESINGAFTIGFPIIPIAPVVKLCINPSFNVAQGADRTRVQFEDIDGDGIADLLESDDDSKLTAYRSTIKRTNKLRKVTRPLGGHFVLNYKRIGNDYSMPNSVWALDTVEIFDGVPGDGADRMLNTIRYESGRFDRNEREFYGFGKVITSNHDTENGNVVYRTIEKEYIVDNYYEKGLVKSEIIKDAAGHKFTESLYSYELKSVQNGNILPADYKKTDDGLAYPALVSLEELYYEGLAAPGKSTKTNYAYDVLGNTVSIIDFGDPGNSDDITTTISYHSVPGKYIMDVPSSTITTGSGVTYRQQATTIDVNNGNLLEERNFLQSGESARYNMEYDAFGNVVKLTRPQNATGQRLIFNYEFDSDVNTFNTKISDSYGYSASMTYDLRFGELTSKTDINGQKTTILIDNVGRISQLRGPLEIAAGIPFTYSIEYHPNAVVPWAMMKNYDPSHPGNFIETASFCDGLGRILQNKKDGAIFVSPGAPDEEVMLVSGADFYDAFGRTIANHHPTREAKGNTGILNTDEDPLTPTKYTYDVLGRMLTTTLPDLTIIKEEYGFGNDRDGQMQFRTRSLDGNGKSTETFTNCRGLLKATKRQYSQGSDVWTSYQYNPVDEVIKVIDDQGNETTSEYDRLGRRTKVIHPDAGITQYKFDLNNNTAEVITANLQGGQGIKYNYDHERVISIVYPKNPKNNVEFTYGQSNSEFFRAGRIVKQKDGSGTQEFFYNPLGAIIKNTRVINLPDGDPLSHTTQWNYDTWNRLTGMTYPDGELLTYKYNVGGNLASMSGVKDGTTYNYLVQLGYDKFESRVYMKYGNGTESTYGYEPDRRRLNKLTAKTSANRLILDNSYGYDREQNILNIVNNAPVPPSNLMGGKSNYQFAYDDLYRLTNSNGTFKGSNHEHRYSLEMQYNSLFNITAKKQKHERKGNGDANWVLQNKTSYEYNYSYDPGAKPHAPVHIGDRSFSYDPNGNQKGWDHDVSAQNRKILWDEENRIQTLSDNGQTFNYKYDGAGDRVLKSVGQEKTVRVNGKVVGQSTGLGNHIVYVNPFIEVRSGQFTKHYYIATERIASKMGESGNGNSNGKQGVGNGNGSPNGNGNSNGVNQEAFQFYYHYDHVGNAAFITDRKGEVYQHLEYFPFGETFIEEHGNQQRTPYLFNGKELDEETGLYYYGARYYDTRISSWPSVDPLWELPDELDKSPYVFVLNNPILYADIDGRGKTPPLEIVFYHRKNYTAKQIAEMKRQLLGQELGLVAITAADFIKRRAIFRAHGRSNKSAYLQQKFRKKHKLKDDEAALHNPDQIAAGDDDPTDRGDLRINSSIGSQWKSRVGKIDTYLKVHKVTGKTKLSMIRLTLKKRLK